MSESQVLKDGDIATTWMRTRSGTGDSVALNADRDGNDPDGKDADGTDGDSGDSDSQDS